MRKPLREHHPLQQSQANFYLQIEDSRADSGQSHPLVPTVTTATWITTPIHPPQRVYYPPVLGSGLALHKHQFTLRTASGEAQIMRD